jgi:hypothetical protein
MRGALIVGGVALVGAGALWLWSVNRAKAEAAAAHDEGAREAQNSAQEFSA